MTNEIEKSSKPEVRADALRPVKQVLAKEVLGSPSVHDVEPEFFPVRPLAVEDKVDIGALDESELIEALYPVPMDDYHPSIWYRKSGRTHTVTRPIKWVPEDLKEIDAKAKAAGLSHAEFMRRAAKGVKIGQGKRPVQDTETDKKYHAILNRIGTNINTLLKAVHTYNKAGCGPDRIDTGALADTNKELLDVLRIVKNRLMEKA